MLIIRPVAMSDHAEILSLACEAGIGMTSLPADADVLAAKIARSEASFAAKPEWSGDEAFFLVLEDTKKSCLIGTCGIVAHVGLKSPFYSYKLSTIVQASSSLGIYSRQRVLHMVNDYTGMSEIGALFLLPEYRRDGIGKFLSRARFMIMAEFPQLFAERVIAEIRGVQDESGVSPFYKHLAQHFFQMDFARADFINATLGGQFISDLMPKYPIYVTLLHQDAQAAIGEPLAASKGALSLLQREGFIYQGYIDLFDGGPTMQIERRNIATIRGSKAVPISAISNISGKTDHITATHMIATTSLANLRIAMVCLQENPQGVVIDQETAAIMSLKPGDNVRIVEIHNNGK